MSKFPFLRLPDLALREVFKQCDFLEIYQLSQVSRKVKSAVQRFNSIFEGIELFYGNSFSVKLKHRGINYDYIFRKEDKSAQNTNLVYLKRVNLSHHRPELGALKLFAEVRDTSRSSAEPQIRVNTERLTDENLNLLVDFLNSKVSPYISITTNQAEKLERLIRNIKSTSEKIVVQSSTNIHNIQIERLECKLLTICGAQWVKIEQLMAFNFNKAVFFDSTLSSRDLNTFLKSWKERRSHQKMERCCFFWETSALNITDVLEGLWPCPEDINALMSNARTFKINGANGKSVTLQLEKGQGSVKFELNVNC